MKTWKKVMIYSLLFFFGSMLLMAPLSLIFKPTRLPDGTNEYSSIYTIIMLAYWIISGVLVWNDKIRDDVISNFKNINRKNEQTLLKEENDKELCDNEILEFESEPIVLSSQIIEEIVDYTYHISPVGVSYSKYTNEIFPDDYVVLDLETTGLSTAQSRIIEVSCLKYASNKHIDTFSSLIDPEVPIPQSISTLTGISASMIRGKPKIYEILDVLLDFIGDNYIICHNVDFDISFLISAARGANYETIPKFKTIDTVFLARKYYRGMDDHKLITFKNLFKIDNTSHRAESDCLVTNKLYQNCKEMYEYDKEIYDLVTDNIMKTFSEEEIEFHEALLDKLSSINAHDKLSFNRMADKTINYKINNMQIGRISFNGKNKRMQILSPNKVIWLDNMEINEAIDKLDLWVKYSKYLLRDDFI